MYFKDEIQRFQPTCQQEETDKRSMLNYLSLFPDTILTRACEPAHMTASSMIFNKSRDKVLMVFHNIYQSWSWTGGHADGESDLLQVALKEAKEETGIGELRVLTEHAFSLDILTVWGHVKRGAYVSGHVHLNLTYLLEADEEQEIHMKEDENSGVCWIPVDQLREYVAEPYMIPLYEKLIRGGRNL